MKEAGLYVASLICGIAWVVTLLLGDAIDILGWAAFALMIIAIVTDQTLGSA